MAVLTPATNLPATTSILPEQRRSAGCLAYSFESPDRLRGAEPHTVRAKSRTSNAHRAISRYDFAPPSRVQVDESHHAGAPPAYSGRGRRLYPGIEAVVLFGSRARGSARATSDWDIAILSHASPENEHAAKRLFGDLERVESIVMNPESIETHCNRGTRLESVIARQGKLLAGALTTSRRQLNEVPAIVSRPCLSQHRLELA